MALLTPRFPNSGQYSSIWISFLNSSSFNYISLPMSLPHSTPSGVLRHLKDKVQVPTGHPEMGIPVVPASQPLCRRACPVLYVLVIQTTRLVVSNTHSCFISSTFAHSASPLEIPFSPTLSP